MSIANGIVSSKTYNKWDDFNFEIANTHFLMEMFLAHLPMVFLFSAYLFARECSNVDDFSNRNLFLTAKVLKQGYRYHKIQKAFSKSYHRHSELIVKYNIGS